MPNAVDSRPVAKIHEFQVNSYRFAVDIVPVIGHTHLRRVWPGSGRCSVPGATTSWDTRYNDIQSEFSLL